jgi:hypothetical protein
MGSSFIAILDTHPKTKPLSPIHHKTLAREGLAMWNGSNNVSFRIEKNNVHKYTWLEAIDFG